MVMAPSCVSKGRCPPGGTVLVMENTLLPLRLISLVDRAEWEGAVWYETLKQRHSPGRVWGFPFWGLGSPGRLSNMSLHLLCWYGCKVMLFFKSVRISVHHNAKSLVCRFRGTLDDCLELKSVQPIFSLLMYTMGGSSKGSST